MDLGVENGVVASCSTHSDLTKMILDDINNISDEEDDYMEDIEEEPCPMDVEDDDMEICFEVNFFLKAENSKKLKVPSQWIFVLNRRRINKINLCFQEPSQMDDDARAYCPLLYWSANSFDIDLKSYGKSSTNHNSNIKKMDKNNTEELIAKFIQRRSYLFYYMSEHSVDVSFCLR